MLIKTGPDRRETARLRTSYLVRELANLNEEVKQEQRDRVADFFTSTLNKMSGTPRCFCLPGVRWAFEHTLSSKFSNSIEFIGAERVYEIIERGRYHMPGRNQLLLEHHTKVRSFKFWETNKARIVWADVSDLMGITYKHFSGKNQYNKFAHNWRFWSCAWLDFTSPIGTEVMSCIKRLETYIDMQQKEVPVAVTFFIGRESEKITQLMDLITPRGDVLNKRVRFIGALCESNRFANLDVVDAWKYKSAGGASMGMMLAILRKKQHEHAQVEVPAV